VEKQKELVGASIHRDSHASSPHAGISTCQRNNKGVFKPNWDVYEELPKGKPLANTNVPRVHDVSTWTIYFPT
jgi:hypothetical protein